MRKDYTIIKKGTYPTEEGEKWVEINGSNGWYMVSNYGRIWSYKRGKLVGAQSGNGYYYVHINGKTYSVHRLVGEYFVPNPDNLPEIDHIDTNPLNNVYTNLRWVDRSGNQRNPLTIEKFKKVNKLKLLSESIKKAQEAKRKKVVQYDCDGNEINVFNSIREAAKKVKISPTCIQDACKGKQKRAAGYYWKYYKSAS